MRDKSEFVVKVNLSARVKARASTYLKVSVWRLPNSQPGSSFEEQGTRIKSLKDGLYERAMSSTIIASRLVVEEGRAIFESQSLVAGQAQKI